MNSDAKIITTGGSTMATRARVAASAGKAATTPTFVVPYRHLDSGWFDFQPMAPMYPAMLWNVCGERAHIFQKSEKQHKVVLKR